ncbi:hypothetical protein G7074_14930 [Pedobacter sp. HDW13]|uniref:hypothetical protein n=1 Tax=Pedobacter sp. HDW13 TaxID=2714940 RepID=UPI0014085571|nr:hypothetical protein [Pedobacter sp. HDW13]QIL40442.1 hypothetical protein G7074_14930 [Pedobacter sp. HDW13]
MKKLFITTFLILCSLLLFSQTRLLEVNEALAKIGLTKTKMTSYLKERGYTFSNAYDGCYSYTKYTNVGEHTLSVCYKASKVNSIGWNELFSYINVATNEIGDLGFKRKDRGTRMWAYYSDKYSITIIPRPQTEDIFIAIGYKNK